MKWVFFVSSYVIWIGNLESCFEFHSILLLFSMPLGNLIAEIMQEQIPRWDFLVSFHNAWIP